MKIPGDIFLATNEYTSIHTKGEDKFKLDKASYDVNLNKDDFGIRVPEFIFESNPKFRVETLQHNPFLNHASKANPVQDMHTREQVREQAKTNLRNALIQALHAGVREEDIAEIMNLANVQWVLET